MPSRRKTPQPKEPVGLTISRDEAASRIKDRIVKGNELKSALVDTHESYESSTKEYRLWEDYNKEMLKRIFTTDEISKEYGRWIGTPVMRTRPPSLGEKIENLHDDIDGKTDRLKSILGRLELIPVTGEEAQPRGAVTVEPQAPSKKVFLVHGHVTRSVSRMVQATEMQPDKFVSSLCLSSLLHPQAFPPGAPALYTHHVDTTYIPDQ